tara:strand:+ start:57 stop:320 length:264 start_codon:yes stop_codon:yes gene_type:complete
MYKIILAILLFFYIFFSNSYSQEKIVFIDIDYIFKNSNAGIDLNKQILKKDEELKLEISNFKFEIENEKKKFYHKKMCYLQRNITKK